MLLFAGWNLLVQRRFYSSCVILAFEHMHQRRIIYRDLKPENLLLTEDGQLKVGRMVVWCFPFLPIRSPVCEVQHP